MVDVRIATGAEQPINSDGTPSTVAASEGDLVALDGNGEIVAADAATGVQEPAVGVLATPVDDPSNYPSEDGQFNHARQQALANRATINDEKVGYVRYGVEVVNEDADWGFTPGEPVYLGEGGGYTQTEPSDVGDLVQYVGVAGPDGESVFLEIDGDYTTVA
jgi:hypothetical protein